MSFILGKRIRDDNSNFHWKNLSELDFKINKPSVLVLGGSGTQGDKDANGYAKLAENILGSFSDDVDILSVNYNHSTNEDEEIEKLVYDLFLPLVSKNNFKINVAQACKNVRKLTILAHCYGYYKITAGIEKKLDFFSCIFLIKTK